MSKYLQLRVHALKCIKMTENRQNIFGFSLETDPDSIDISTVAVDAEQGVLVNAPTVFLGNRYENGRVETFRSPKVIAEVPINETDSFPRSISVAVNMAEKDDGAGFDELMDQVSRELASELSEELADEVDDLIEGRAEDTVKKILSEIFKSIGRALGLGDDPFRPVTLISPSLQNYGSDLPNTLQRVKFHEPNPSHKGEFELTYDWHVSSSRSINSSSSAGSVGLFASALTKSNGSPREVGYPRGIQTYRFRQPKAKKPIVNRISIGYGVRPWFWYTTPIRIW